MPLNLPGGGKVLQVGCAVTTTQSSTAATIPADGTIPQIGEGTQFLSLNITPKRPDSTLYIVLQGQISNNANNTACVALFKDGAANAIGANAGESYGESQLPPLIMPHVPGSVAPIAFTARYGSASGTTQLNRSNATRSVGGQVSSLTVIEVAP
jgi:hypothetical protein